VFGAAIGSRITSFFDIADVHVGPSAAVPLGFLVLCMAIVSGYRLKN
jgi:ABC-type transporter Mla maintaining outer membrane lipid asymmetry permease subunit MlaE